jgi:DNA-binding response OmpR family regulator
MDTWLRQVFVPALGDNARVYLFGREAPVSAWLASPGWHGLFRSVRLEPLDESEAAELLLRTGVAREDAPRINRVARGHPLALKLAAGVFTEQRDLQREDVAGQRVVEELTRMYLADVRDPVTREALDAASVVRCATWSLLRAMLPHAAPQDAFERLGALPFVESTASGLMLHDAVQQAIASTLRAADPLRCRSCRRAAWQELRSEVRTAGRPELWRYTADMLYLIENPVVREAFFPTGAQLFAVEPARPDDGPAIRSIAERHEGPRAAALLDSWWRSAPQSFAVVRDRNAMAAGFYCMFDPATVSPALLRDDPVTSAWSQHLRGDPVPRKQRVLFIRRWLGLERGEAPSPVQAACWLDIKRTYMAMRPHLRRAYLTVCDLPTYAPVAVKLGFRPFAEPGLRLDGATYHSAVLDFGPSSVDGWLASLVDAELGVADDALLDADARELVVDGRRVGLTNLEFFTMQYLCEHEGKAVARQSFLADVWGHHYEGASNVVDVVVRSLRKKLGPRASAIETVSRVGYRFRRG